jgi:hypothetical protein
LPPAATHGHAEDIGNWFDSLLMDVNSPLIACLVNFSETGRIREKTVT